MRTALTREAQLAEARENLDAALHEVADGALEKDESDAPRELERGGEDTVVFDLVAGARLAASTDEAARQIPDEDALMYQECGGPSSAERTTCPPTYGTFPDPTTLAIR